MRQGLVLVISAPSGAGKSTLIRRLREAMPGLGYSVSHTTRPPRPGERDGVEYHFVDRATFEAMRDGGEFAEWAEVHGNLYGTALTELRTAAEAGQDLVLDIDVQGALQVAQRLPHAVLVFVLPPSWEELRRRLVERGQDSPEVIERRLANARREVSVAPRYDYVVVNDDVDRCLGELVAVVRAERCRPVRQREALDRLLGARATAASAGR